jgi:predicted Rossmann fold nucleotide-binding protein DprA/Smf involved in DNA uptake
MILAIVGTRQLNPYLERYAKLIIISEIPGYDSVVTGDADGIDKLVMSTCEEHGMPCDVLAPLNRRWEPEGFRDRNTLIVARCTRLLCLRDPSSASYGSGWTYDYAKSAGKDVTKVEIS